MTMTELPTTLRTEADGTTTVVTDMRDLLAAATVSSHKNTKNRHLLRTVYVTNGCIVATDSYRLVIVGHGNAAELHQLGKDGAGKGFPVPVELVTTAGKLAKTGPATVSTDGATVTLVAGGQTFTADRPDMVHGGDFPSYGSLLPNVDAGTGMSTCSPTWDAGYMADVAKIGRHLKESRDIVTMRLVAAEDDLKPSLWYVGGCRHGAALYLLMPIRNR